MPLNLIVLFLLFVSSNLFAQIPLNNALSFAPPPSDRSMVYLAEIFGNVDGVLAGTGSQIFGHLMEIFNSTVLALGSILVMYAIIGGTLNTAQEGEFLGKQWSSIWVPVRSVIGVSILAPKASGFSVIQILIMWIIVQGVGAADKVWNVTLDYLNQGGAIIQLQQSSAQISGGSDSNPAYEGAITMLAGQVCMKGLQELIEVRRKQLLDQKANNVGPCSDAVTNVNNNWKDFCSTSVPQFISSFDAVSSQQESTADSVVVSLPNFANSIQFYKNLNGICGKLKWNKVTPNTNITLNANQQNNFILARAIATQQMYNFLTPVALSMVNNSPAITQDPNFKNSDCANELLYGQAPNQYCYGRQQFGVALNKNGAVCQSTTDCDMWSNTPNSKASSVLFTGTEFNSAVGSYQGLMSPVLNLINQFGDSKKVASAKAREFIQKSKQEGWIFAGSYFFNLVELTQSTVNNPVTRDSNSGLDGSELLSQQFDQQVGCDQTPPNTLCWLFKENDSSGQNFAKLARLKVLITGNSTNSNAASLCTSNLRAPGKQSTGYISNPELFTKMPCSNTVLGYIGNSFFLNVAGSQDAPKDLKLTLGSNLVANINAPDLGWPSFACGGFLCIGRVVGALIWTIFWAVNTAITTVVKYVVNYLIDGLIIYPIKQIIFPVLEKAYNIINTPSLNPIVNLANLGGYMIQETVNGYFFMMANALIGATPILGPVFMLIMAFALPLYAAWLSLFLGIGFSTAYFVPLVPYLTFTFGAIGWLFAVIEAMVAAPVLALGVMSLEGEGVVGKSEQGFLLIVNVFLRPAMMIIGFILGISLSYVSVWMLQAGFTRAADFLVNDDWNVITEMKSDDIFVAIFARGFYVFIYISIYTLLVQKAFTMIYILPDKVMRWIGGSAETYGSEAAQWMEETKNKAKQFGEATDKGMAQGFGKFQESSAEVASDVASGITGGISAAYKKLTGGKSDDSGAVNPSGTNSQSPSGGSSPAGGDASAADPSAADASAADASTADAGAGGASTADAGAGGGEASASSAAKAAATGGATGGV
jgi:defect-in-organelle-trafficking protein DotA